MFDKITLLFKEPGHPEGYYVFKLVLPRETCEKMTMEDIISHIQTIMDIPICVKTHKSFEDFILTVGKSYYPSHPVMWGFFHTAIRGERTFCGGEIMRKDKMKDLIWPEDSVVTFQITLGSRKDLVKHKNITHFNWMCLTQNENYLKKWIDHYIFFDNKFGIVLDFLVENWNKEHVRQQWWRVVKCWKSISRKIVREQVKKQPALLYVLFTLRTCVKQVKTLTKDMCRNPWKFEPWEMKHFRDDGIIPIDRILLFGIKEMNFLNSGAVEVK